jgi:hypothetical protein
MQAIILNNHDVRYLDKMLVKDGFISPIEAKYLKSVPQEHLSIWAHKNAVYCIPTIELIQWFKNEIDNKKAIEICSGNGAIGRALGITRTDSYMQTTPEMVLYYRSLGQVPISPPKDVLKFEANEAVDFFMPQVVVGSWVSQKLLSTDREEIGSAFGVDENRILTKVEKYINIGNNITHKDKRILKIPHKVYQFDWLYTRSMNPSDNSIKVWTNAFR